MLGKSSTLVAVSSGSRFLLIEFSLIRDGPFFSEMLYFYMTILGLLTTHLKICFYAFVLLEEVPMVPMLPDKIPIVGRSERDLMFFTNRNNKRKLERVKKTKRNR